MKINFLIAALAALFPMVLGAVWYSEKLFGKAWVESTGIPIEKMKSTHMGKVFGISYLCCFFVAVTLNFVTIHQWGVFSSLANSPDLATPGTDLNNYFMDFMAKYGTNFRTFKHGALHGTITGLLFITPVLTINALFEARGFKYIAINAGYWIISLAVMGGIVCQFG